MKQLTKTVLAMLAAGLLIGGVTGLALAQSASPYNGAGGPDVSYPPNYNGIQSLNGFTNEGQAGGYTGYPPDYSNAPNSNGWIHMGPNGVEMGAPSPTSHAQPVVPVAPYLGDDQRSSHTS